MSEPNERDIGLDLDRCDWCGWPLKDRIEDGCTWDNCSMRPRPQRPDTELRQALRKARREVAPLLARIAELERASDTADWRVEVDRAEQAEKRVAELLEEIERLTKEAAHWHSTAGEINVRLSYAEERAAEAEKKLMLVIGAAQRFQPAGSPPPGGSDILVTWICSTLFERAEKAEREGACDACAGTGNPISGLPCMCNGTGRASVAVTYLREKLVKAEHDRDELRQVHASQSLEIARLQTDIEQALKDRDGVAVHLVEANRRLIELSEPTVGECLCAGEWISGSGGHRVHSPCRNHADIYDPPYAYCFKHDPDRIIADRTKAERDELQAKLAARDELWRKAAVEHFEGVLDFVALDKLFAVDDRPQAIFHEVWKRDPRVDELRATLNELREQVAHICKVHLSSMGARGDSIRNRLQAAIAAHREEKPDAKA